MTAVTEDERWHAEYLRARYAEDEGDVGDSPPEDDDDGRRADGSEGRQEKPTFREQLLSLSDLGNLPAVEPLVDGLLYRNTLVQLAGPPGSYKSFISVGLSCALASGQRTWVGHHIPKREKVVYVAAEGATGLRVRSLAWCERNKVAPDVLEGWLYFLPVPVQLGNGMQVDDAVEMVKDIGAGLLVLDTRARCTLGLEENSATEQGLAVDAADRIRQAAGCTVWGIHHTGRTGTTPRGSTAWDGAVWSDLRLTSDDHAAAIKVEKHKDVPSGHTFDYRLVPHTVSEESMPGVPEKVRKSLVVFPNDDGNLGGIPTRVGNSVWEICGNSCGLEGLSRSKLVELCVEAGIPKSSAYRAVNDLIERSLLTNVGTEKQRRYVCAGPTLGGDDDA
jgi:AAA domain